jgi:uncharacterized protein
MNRTFKAAVAALMLAVGLAGSAVSGPQDAVDAADAYSKGEYATALRLMRPLAEHGVVPAQSLLAGMYAKGLGVLQDYEAAVKWWRKAAEQGLDEAQYNLGLMYDDGHGVPQNSATAVSWYRKAAEQGYVQAQLNLGAMYYNGEGVPQDYVAAHMWFNLAAVSGDKKATSNRNKVSARMTPAQIAEAQKLAREWKPE